MTAWPPPTQMLAIIEDPSPRERPPAAWRPRRRPVRALLNRLVRTGRQTPARAGLPTCFDAARR
jgi:hypothetical protein